MLTENERLLLKAACLKFNQFLGLFTSPSSSAFHAIVSLITKGVGSSPSKARKRTSFLELFAVFHSNSLIKQNKNISKKSPEISPELITMNYFEFAEGMRTLSSRIASFHIDEILTLTVLIDFDSDGYISWDDFFSFCTLCDMSQANDVNPVKCFELLFLDLLKEKTKSTSQSVMLKKLSEDIITLRKNSISLMKIFLESTTSHKHDSVMSPNALDVLCEMIIKEVNEVENRKVNNLNILQNISPIR